jgi:hypothetical protein
LRHHIFSDPRLRYVAVYTGRNAAIDVVARLVIRNSLHQPLNGRLPRAQ